MHIAIVDDHELTGRGTANVLRERYPEANIAIATTVAVARERLTAPLDLLVMDLSLPEMAGGPSKVDSGLELLRSALEVQPPLNIVVQSTYTNALVRVKADIDNHEGGFTIADKSLSSAEMLNRIAWALQGVTHTKDIQVVQRGLEVRPEWLQVLDLAFQEGLQDKAIAERLHVTERTVRHYWSKIQDVLGIYPEESKKEGKNLRVLTEIRAREAGLVD
ncbi:MAG: response regulator transcription factor [Cyanobacteria bacterium J06641_5]